MIPLNQKNQGGSPHSYIRSGATLVELLVVMAIITALGALALMVMPTVTNSDNTLKATADVQSTLKISQSMAAVSRMPRGVRFIVNPTTNLCTEMQYLEAPPVLVPDPQVLVAKDPGNLQTNNPLAPQNGPRVDFSYELDPTTKAIINRKCVIRKLTSDQWQQVEPGATLVMPTLNAWSKVKQRIGVGQAMTDDGTVADTGYSDVEVELEVYPDAQLGAGTLYRTYHFGIYGRAVPLIGEPTILLQKGSAVDFNVSSPVPLVPDPADPTNPAKVTVAPMSSYDVLFAPSGQLLYSPTNPTLSQSSAVFLWVRDTTKDNKLPSTGMRPAGGRWAFGGQGQFQVGGEMQIVGIRNGFIGTAPVTWPGTDGSYPSGSDPYSDARERLK